MKLRALIPALIASLFLAGTFLHAANADGDFLKYTSHNPDQPEHTLDAAAFASPSGWARPQTWWHWLNGNVSRAGIEADLREMADKGIGQAQVFSVGNRDKNPAPVPFASPEWFDLFRFATETAAKHGIEVGIHNCDGWSEAGGPWITPEQSMKELTFKTLRVTGNGAEQSIALPELDRKLDFVRDIAVLAWPAKGPSGKSPVTRFKFMAGAASDRGSGPEGAAPSKPVPPERALRLDEIRNLTASVTGGALRWRVPDGEWVVMRVGYTTTGKTTYPATAEGRGLEVDKFEPAFVNQHFDGYSKKMLDAAGPLAGKTFSVIETDSWEAGHQNWTQNFERYFREQNGYDILPWLAVYAGECIGDITTTENFLRDLRQTFAALIAKNFYETMAARIHAAGLRYETQDLVESFARNPLGGYRASDVPMGTLWQPHREKNLINNIRVSGPAKLSRRAEAASASHFYGKRYVAIETITGRRGNWAHSPWSLKGTVDSSFLDGANLLVFHTFSHQPDERSPGWQMNPWGTAQNRKLTWWPFSKPWFTYISRTQYMLQQGKTANRVLYFYSDQVPSGSAHLALRSNHQYDIADGDAVRNFLRVENGRLASPGRMNYELMVVSKDTTLLPETLEKLKTLVEAGARVSAEKKPAFNPTLRGGAEAGARWQKLVAELFGDGSKSARKIGKGVFYAGHTPDEAIAALGLREPFTCMLDDAFAPKDIAWTHREHIDGSEWFHIANKDSTAPRSGIMSFDVAGKPASIWHPETGEITPVPVLDEADGRTRIPLALAPLEGVFVVFGGKNAPRAQPASSVTVDGKPAFPVTPPPPADDQTIIDNKTITKNFTVFVTVSPAAKRRVTERSTTGVISLDGENILLVPEEMHKKVGDKKHACAGLSVGRNSIAVFEHGASFRNSVLVWNNPVPQNARIALVYKNNVPTLYLNGRQIAAGSASGRVVHPPATLRGAFRGGADGFSVHDTTFDASKILADARAKNVAPDTIKNTAPSERPALADNTALAGDFTVFVTASPSADRPLTKQNTRGIVSLDNENLVLYPDQMHKALGDNNHACAGLSVGRNSIAVFEHGERFRNSVLVWDNPVPKNARIALVYKDNVPALYLNGKQIAAGSASGRIVHPPAGTREAFKGKAREFAVYDTALDAKKITADSRASASGRARNMQDSPPALADNAAIATNFTVLVTATPAADRPLTEQQTKGVISLKNENILLYPEEMHKKAGDDAHACAGLSVGRNSIAVFEHGARFRNTVLVWDNPVPENARIALVYKNNVPALYLNGKQIATGSASGRVVHPPAAIQGLFKGRATGFAVYDKAFDAKKIAALDLAKAPPPECAEPEPKSPRLYVTTKGKMGAEFFTPGKVEIKKAGGQTRALAADKIPEPKTLAGPWAVTFDAKWGAPAGPQRFATLTSWTESREPGIKHYSGVATYEKEIALDKNETAAGQRVYLEIDQVCEVAQVTVNGKLAGTLWRPPYRLDITDAVRPGKNTLQIAVANTWVNRCLHDATLPESERLTWANTMDVHFPDPKKAKPANSIHWAYGPLPSGLIGTAKLAFSKLVEEK
ncbi:hypothetical protein M2447_001943 [Ereboglobus sp. PH5-10]|uniref:glycosyl hydrolase n=1 Tax=Ereboglobus sp. PH5-10 TaxID=2940629 RepID=UPI002406F9CC|nr:glycosyl hydrolase [Ereboglobus sp. PH5-10]MDF9827841.1 hypothetical protein [Ereboglobus sp. PH5-10]